MADEQEDPQGAEQKAPGAPQVNAVWVDALSGAAASFDMVDIEPTKKMLMALKPRQRTFLTALRVTPVNKTAACRNAGIATSTLRRWMQKPKFRTAFDIVQQGALGIMAHSVAERLTFGWNEPVFGDLGDKEGTGIVGHKRKFDNAGAMRFLRSWDKRYNVAPGEDPNAGEESAQQAGEALQSFLKAAEEAVPRCPADWESPTPVDTVDAMPGGMPEQQLDDAVPRMCVDCGTRLDRGICPDPDCSAG
ncbi:MAG: hypothetical protein GY716_16060 [bacterium]|nr:hypothetical protein [bacterium]